MRILLFTCILFVSVRSNSQILFAGNQVIEAYLGMPNMARLTGGLNLMTAEMNPGEVTKFKGLAPSGVRYTYMLTENLSFGVDLIYNSSNVTRVKYDTLYDGVSGQWLYTDTTFQDISQRIRFHARMNFHIQTGRPEADSYIGIGFGTNNRWIQTIKDGKTAKIAKGEDASLLPFSMRICYGYRYFFGYNWGISGEVGLGGPLLSLGLAYKL